MRKLRSLTGMPVVCGNHRLGRLLQAELAEDLRSLSGIWVGTGLRGTRFIPAESLELVGRVAVLADEGGRKMRMRHQPLFRRAVSTDGRRLGAITGADIDELSFAVTALELSSGLWDDLIHGRRRVRDYTVNRDDGEVIVNLADNEREGSDCEERIDEGTGHRHADRRIGGHHLRGHELADGEEVEPEGEADGQLDL